MKKPTPLEERRPELCWGIEHPESSSDQRIRQGPRRPSLEEPNPGHHAQSRSTASPPPLPKPAMRLQAQDPRRQPAKRVMPCKLRGRLLRGPLPGRRTVDLEINQAPQGRRSGQVLAICSSTIPSSFHCVVSGQATPVPRSLTTHKKTQRNQIQKQMPIRIEGGALWPVPRCTRSTSVPSPPMPRPRGQVGPDRR